MMNIAIATENPAKVESADRGLREFYAHNPEVEYGITAIATESGVSETPLSDEEGLLGCENRINAAELALPGQDLYIALEGVLAQVRQRWYVRGWTIIKDAQNNRMATACGAAVQVPVSITSRISAIDQFSDIVKRHYSVTPEESHELRNIGANGVFSNGEYTRYDTFYDGVRICLAQLANKRNWS